MAKTSTEKQRTLRKNNREKGLVLKHVWANPKWWPEVQALIKQKRAE